MAQDDTGVAPDRDTGSRRCDRVVPASWARLSIASRRSTVSCAECRLTLRTAGRRSLDGGEPSERRRPASGSRTFRTTGGLPAWLGTTAIVRAQR